MANFSDTRPILAAQSKQAGRRAALALARASNAWGGLAFLALCVSGAQVRALDLLRQDGWSIGLLTAYATNPYIGEDTELVPYPLITYRNGPFAAGTFGITYDFVQSDALRLTAGVTPRFIGLLSTDASELDGIDRELTADFQLTAAYAFSEALETELTYRKEITGEHDGQSLDWQIGYTAVVGDMFLNATVGASWQSEDLANYVWGVAPSEGRAGRAAYDVGDVVIPFVEASALLPLSDHWTMIAALRADMLEGAITNSPIIDRDELVSVTIGLEYRF